MSYEKNKRSNKHILMIAAALFCCATWWACDAGKTPGTEPGAEPTPDQVATKDAGAQDKGAADTGTVDTGTPDTGAVDTGSVDTAKPTPDQTPVVDDPPPERTTPEAKPENTARKTVFGGSRPATIKVPPDYDHSKEHPLLVLLHGYGATGAVQSLYFGIDKLVQNEGVLVIAPDGQKDPTGKQFWNGTKACCNFVAPKIDDVSYLRGLVQEISGEYNVDKKRIYFVGHSNGGFMSYHMACKASNMIAAIVSLAGATFTDPADCSPTDKVSVLQIHGTQDKTIGFGGGNNAGITYPGAIASVDMWAKYNKCTGQLKDTGTKKDLENNLAGDETTVSSTEGCATGLSVDLWTIVNGGHIPVFSPTYIEQVWAWLKAHPKVP